MATAALNKFVRNSQILQTSQSTIYTAPYQKAGIIVSALASNVTSNTTTITLAISAFSNSSTYDQITRNPYIINAFQLAPNDTSNVVVGKLVLNANESLVAQCGSNNSVHLTVSVLETPS